MSAVTTSLTGRRVDVVDRESLVVARVEKIVSIRRTKATAGAER